MLGRKPNALLLPLILVVGTAIVFAVGTGKPAPEAAPELPDPIPTVRVEAIERGTESLWVNSQGVVEPALKTVLTAQVAGRINFVDEQFANGGKFAEGGALIQIERADYEIAVRVARASLADAERALAVEKGAARQARREWRDLGSEDANQLFLRKPQLAAATANVEAAKARLQQAELDLKRTTISAPYEGFVAQKAVDVGQFVAAGSRLGEVYATTRFEIRLPLAIQERYLLGDAVGRQVDIYTEQLGKRLHWQGEIIRVESSIDAASRQFYVVASVDEPYSDAANTNSGGIPLSVGQFVQASIASVPQSGVFRIPRSALRQPNKIWVVEDSDQLAFYDVDIVYRDMREAVVRVAALDLEVATPDSEIAAPDSKETLQLVVSDLSVARPGQRVNVKDTLVQPSSRQGDTAVTETVN